MITTVSGIYQITNKITGDFYIGSSCNINKRWRRHELALDKGKHHSVYLCRSYAKYGKDSFEYKVLENVPKDLLLEKEQYYIDACKPIYNTCKIAGSSIGIRQSEETKALKRKYAIENNIKPPAFTYEQKRKEFIC